MSRRAGPANPFKPRFGHRGTVQYYAKAAGSQEVHKRIVHLRLGAGWCHVLRPGGGTYAECFMDGGAHRRQGPLPKQPRGCYGYPSAFQADDQKRLRHEGANGSGEKKNRGAIEEERHMICPALSEHSADCRQRKAALLKDERKLDEERRLASKAAGDK